MDVVRRIKRTLKGIKVGHTGTLDPLATGVVVCCIGRATRSTSQIMSLTKGYQTHIDLSAFTTTDDREGHPKPIDVAQPPSRQQIQTTLKQFIGWIHQTPPPYSAIHINGTRAYKLARKGQTVNLAPRVVRIDKIETIAYTWPNLEIQVTCGKGVYIRSLARELGYALGTGGHLADLRRTAIGPYQLSQAVNMDRLDQPITQADLLNPTEIPM